jgi:hypothetical protein
MWVWIDMGVREECRSYISFISTHARAQLHAKSQAHTLLRGSVGGPHIDKAIDTLQDLPISEDTP